MILLRCNYLFPLAKQENCQFSKVEISKKYGYVSLHISDIILC